jgi:hypothetical protein
MAVARLWLWLWVRCARLWLWLWVRCARLWLWQAMAVAVCSVCDAMAVAVGSVCDAMAVAVGSVCGTRDFLSLTIFDMPCRFTPCHHKKRFTGSTDARPDACDSQTLPDDRSKLGQLCHIWGSTYSEFDVPRVTSYTQTWGIQLSDGGLHDPVPDNRLYQFPMMIYGSPSELRALLPVGGRGAHFAIDGQQNRFECDNYPRGGSSPGDEWMIFVR